MNRKDFIRSTGLLALAGTVLPTIGFAAETSKKNKKLLKKAKNIIFLVSDGMSTGTLNMADLLLQQKTGKGSNWLGLYRDDKIKRALMDTASASSLVTDSAAGSSSWGGGIRVANGSLNVSEKGEEYLPIWQKFKRSGKKVGCVTSVMITHATPAGFCVNSKSRNGQEEIAEKYLNLRFDVMMGGGTEAFSPELRKDKKDLFQLFSGNKFEVFKSKTEMIINDLELPVLGVFHQDGLPFSIDREQDKSLQEKVPTLAEMTHFAIQKMKNNKNGFVLQVEAGKVDWAAHANDISALLYDQIAFDEAVKTAIDFAEKDGNTLVIITTDHGNANPGLIYGKDCNKNFESIQYYKQTNEWVLMGLSKDSTVQQVQERVEFACGCAISKEEATELLSYYSHLDENGIYNPKKLPFKKLAEIQSKKNSVGWISMDHSADFVELAMFGPGSELLPAFVKNTDLHYLMLDACEIENKF